MVALLQMIGIEVPRWSTTTPESWTWQLVVRLLIVTHRRLIPAGRGIEWTSFVMIMSHAKMAELIEMPFGWDADCGGPEELGRVQISVWRGSFKGKRGSPLWSIVNSGDARDNTRNSNKRLAVITLPLSWHIALSTPRHFWHWTLCFGWMSHNHQMAQSRPKNLYIMTEVSSTHYATKQSAFLIRPFG